MQDKNQFTEIDNGLRVLAPAKINLSLLIAGKRPDGFHEIETLMSKVNYYDQLLIEPAEQHRIEVISTGPHWAPQGEENLIYTACQRILDKCHSNKKIKVTLHKNIPAGTGLGSASSDAAATLVGVNKFLNLGLNDKDLSEIAATLGSDVPFFLDGPLAFCTGRGEKIEKIDKIFNFTALLILPDINCCTKKVYSNYTHDKKTYTSLKEQINALIEKNRFDLVTKMCANMLEKTCFGLYDSLAELKSYAESVGLEHVCLSGSGSCIYSIFDSRDEDLVAELQRNLNSRFSCSSVIVSNNRW